ncbi:hypothetical protein [Psychroserpens sp. MEBiC05023]
MAPIKFEDNIKEKLEERTLQPSQDAWSQLSSKLDSKKKNNSKSMFLYVGIAASFIGVLLVITVFFNGLKIENTTNVVVDVPTETPQPKEEKVMISQESDQVVETNTNVNSTNVQKETTVLNRNSPIINKQSNVASISEEHITHQPKNKLASLDEVKAPEIVTDVSVENSPIDSSLNELTYEDAKAIEVASEIKKLEIKNGEVTNAEIEALLKQAEKDILRQRIYDETTRTVDADALLQDVEEDLERSFRTKVFESLKSSYKTVKTAVAERNN